MSYTVESLTETQIQILEIVNAGFHTAASVARATDLTVATIRRHLRTLDTFGLLFWFEGNLGSVMCDRHGATVCKGKGHVRVSVKLENEDHMGLCEPCFAEFKQDQIDQANKAEAELRERRKLREAIRATARIEELRRQAEEARSMLSRIFHDLDSVVCRAETIERDVLMEDGDLAGVLTEPESFHVQCELDLLLATLKDLPVRSLQNRVKRLAAINA